MADIGSTGRRFDRTHHTWMLARYSDVCVALREPQLVPSDIDIDAPDTPVAIPDAARATISPSSIDGWQSDALTSAARLASTLPANRPLDLMADFAAPWSLGLAVTAGGASPADADRLVALSAEIFRAAAHATSGRSDLSANDAIARLAAALASRASHSSLAVQSFVALSQTLPHFLAASWLALIRDPEQMRALRSSPELLPRAVEELLRYAGPSRAVFRRARSDLSVGDACIARGDRVTLLLAAANRDPARFADPIVSTFGATPEDTAFGRGDHSCVGASLIRMAVTAATAALLGATSDIELAGDVRWLDGFAIRAPSCLPVMLRRQGP